MIVFDGRQFAQKKEVALAQKVAEFSGPKPSIACILFTEDEGGVIYTREKKEVASRVGMQYEVFEHSITEPLRQLVDQITNLAQNPKYTGIIIQKPMRKTWETFITQPTLHTPQSTFNNWWHHLTSTIPLHKDIDGLHPETLASIQNHTWQEKKLVLPATCRAVISIIEHINQELSLDLSTKSTVILGRSELLGLPLYYELLQSFSQLQLFGKKELDQQLNQPEKLRQFGTIITSTGIANLVKGEYLSQDTIIIDIGYPKADAEFETVKDIASFLTPVPNGVGPVTVISLLENALDLCYNHSSIS